MKRCQACRKNTEVTALGPVLLCRDCYPDAEIERVTIQDRGESFDVTLWAKRKRNRLRINCRNKELSEKAQELGFNGLSDMLTKWKNGEITFKVVE